MRKSLKTNKKKQNKKKCRYCRRAFTSNPRLGSRQIACSGSKGPPFRFKRATLPFQKGHPSVSEGPPFRFKRATLPFQKGHPSVSEGPPFRFRRATLPFQKGHLSGNFGMVFYLFKKRALGV